MIEHAIRLSNRNAHVIRTNLYNSEHVKLDDYERIQTIVSAITAASGEYARRMDENVLLTKERIAAARKKAITFQQEQAARGVDLRFDTMLKAEYERIQWEKGEMDALVDDELGETLITIVLKDEHLYRWLKAEWSEIVDKASPLPAHLRQSVRDITHAIDQANHTIIDGNTVSIQSKTARRK